MLSNGPFLNYRIELYNIFFPFAKLRVSDQDSAQQLKLME
jgi:hypothetical protein